MSKRSACSRCGEFVSPDMKYACPERKGLCPIFGGGSVFEPMSAPADADTIKPRPMWSKDFPSAPGAVRWWLDTASRTGAPLFLGRLLRDKDGRGVEWWMQRMAGSASCGGDQTPYDPHRYLWTDQSVQRTPVMPAQAKPAPPSSLWSSEIPLLNGPYWVHDSSRSDGEQVFAAWLTKRNRLRTKSTRRVMWDAQGFLREIEPHLLWHPWRESPPEPPPKPEPVDPGDGVWSDRPWRPGLHRVSWKSATGADFREDVLVQREVSDSLCVRRFLFSPVLPETFGGDARWYRYPEPPAEVP